MRLFCSICKEIFIPYSEIKVTSCGHLYHGSCISRWFKQHKSCPQCRSTLQSQPFRVYLDVEKDHVTDTSTLEHQIETLSDKLRENEIANKNLREEKESCEKIMESMKECATGLKQKNDLLKTSLKALKEQVSHLLKQNKEMSHLENEVEVWKSKTITLKKMELLLERSADDVEKWLETTPKTELSVRQLVTYVVMLKKQMQASEEKYLNLAEENRELVRSLNKEKKKNSNQSEEMVNNLKTAYSALEKELQCMKKLVEDCSKKHIEKENHSELSAKPISQKTQRSAFKLDLEILDEELIDKFKESKTKQIPKHEELSKTINYWEDLVSAGPSRNFSRSFNKSKLFNKSSTNDVSRNESSYAFDGLGGRKKIRLGGPTPRDEFEKIKKNDERRSAATTFKHKKIVDFYCLD